MKIRAIVFPFIAGFLLISCIEDETVYKSTPPNQNLQLEIQELVKKELDTYKVSVPDYPGGIAFKVQYGKFSCFTTSGLGSNVADNIHFRAASNTKTFTATAILLLYQQGKLDLNARITDTIPGTSETYVPNTMAYNLPYKSSIRILDLLRHRAGVYDVTNEIVPDTVSVPLPYKGMNYVEYIYQTDKLHSFTFDELIGVVSGAHLSYFSPGTSYHYSNTGYSILGKIIERVSGKTYQNFLMEKVIRPMGLRQSFMPVSGTDRVIPSPFASGFVLTADTLYNVTQSNVSVNVAEGNLITTPADLAKFLQKLLTGRGVLSPRYVNSILMNYVPTSEVAAGGYGCGLSYTSGLGYGHTGAHEGYLSYMIYDPEMDLTMVAFTNVWNLKGGSSTMYYQLTDVLESLMYKTKVLLKFGDGFNQNTSHKQNDR